MINKQPLRRLLQGL